MDVPLIFDDQFPTRFAIIFPQSVGFYILIHSVAVLNLRQGAQCWCTGMTLRDGMGREWRGVQDGEHMYTHG